MRWFLRKAGCGAPALAAFSLLFLAFACAADKPGTGLIDATRFGAVGDGVSDNTKALQAALDAAGQAATSPPPGDRHAVRTVRIPAGVYLFYDTLWVPDGVEIKGDGWSTQLVMAGLTTRPALVVGVDDPIATAADRPDLFGILDASAAPGPGLKRGFWTGRNAYLLGPHNDLSLGRYDGSAFGYWKTADTLAVDVCLVREAGKSWPPGTALLGLGQAPGVMRPRPWFLHTSYTAPNRVELSYCTDAAEGEERGADSSVGVDVPAEASVIRLSFQVSLARGQAVGWYDGKQGAIAQAPPGRRFRANDDWPLVVGRGGWGTAPPTTSLELAGLRVGTGERWVVGDPGSLQARTDGGTTNDQFRYFDRSDGQAVGFLTLEDAVEARTLTTVNSQGIPGSLFVCRGGQGGGEPNRLADFSLVSPGAGVVIGAVLNLRADNLRVMASAGPAIGSLPLVISYPVDLTGCRLDSHDAPVQAWTWIGTLDRCVFTGGRQAVRARGGSLDVLRAFVAQPKTGIADAAFAFLPGDYGSSTHRVVRAVVNSESSGFEQAVVVAWQPEGNYQPASLTVEDLDAGMTGPTPDARRPIVRLRSWGAARPTANARIAGLRSTGATAAVRSFGPGWTWTNASPQASAQEPDGPGKKTLAVEVSPR